MNLTQLKHFSYKLLKARNRMEEAAKKDAALAPIFTLLDQAWTKSYRLRNEREQLAASRKDKGEVSWEVFDPKLHRVTTRTPHRLITQWCHYFGWDPREDEPASVSVRDSADDRFAYDFNYAMGRRNA